MLVLTANDGSTTVPKEPIVTMAANCQTAPIRSKGLLNGKISHSESHSNGRQLQGVFTYRRPTRSFRYNPTNTMHRFTMALMMVIVKGLTVPMSLMKMAP